MVRAALVVRYTHGHVEVESAVSLNRRGAYDDNGANVESDCVNMYNLTISDCVSSKASSLHSSALHSFEARVS